MGAIKFNDKEFEDTGEQVTDTGVLLEGVEELGDSESTAEPYQEKIADELVVGGEFVKVVPGETGEKVGEEARLEVSKGDLVGVQDQGEGVGLDLVIANQEPEEDVKEEKQLPRHVQQENLLGQASEEPKLHGSQEG